MKKVGVLLSGCGVFDGAEIQETVLTLLALERGGVEAVCMAPNKDQYHVINHLTGEVMDERRNVLVESARIARGEIEDLAGMGAEDMDALILPGGFGAAKNLNTFALDGPKAEIDPEVRRLIREVHEAKKPIGLLCIAPAVGAQVLGELGVELTIGNDAGTAEGIEAFGARHIVCGVMDIHADQERRVLSTPAYMLGQNIQEVSTGIDELVKTLIEWIS
ncbi:MAG: isoprenoid biosynthesis glyoxalase ElbB [Oceanipulchritudo sp.]